MSNKRKSKKPLRFDSDKRSCLNWNLTQTTAENGEIDVETVDLTGTQTSSTDVESQTSSTDVESQTSQTSSTDVESHEKEELNKLLKYCEFYIRVFKTVKESCYRLGDFTIALNKENRERIFYRIENTGLFWFYGSRIPDKNLIYFEDKSGKFEYFIVDEVQIPFEILESLNSNKLLCSVDQLNTDSLQLQIFINYPRSNVFQLSFTSERCIRKSHLNKIIPYYFPNCRLSVEYELKNDQKEVKESDIETVFEAIKEIHEKQLNLESEQLEVQHWLLIPHLRPYQKQGVAWMLKKEKVTGHRSNGSTGHQSNDDTHCLYEEIFLPDGEKLYYNKYGGFLVKNRPTVQDELSGGILADEMGLGKTVQVLACILNNQRVLQPVINDSMNLICSQNEYFKLVEGRRIPIDADDDNVDIFSNNKNLIECFCGNSSDNELTIQCRMCYRWQHAHCVNYDVDNSDLGEYRCPHCHLITAPIESGATLIVSPRSICHQWHEEILKHIRHDSLKVIIYTGVNKDLTDWNNVNSARKLRHHKRFVSTPSPLTAVQWWRICLDEAQMVGCTSSRASDMALRLHAINRWCVTGTPTHNSVKDLYGLFLFVGTDPFYVRHWWNVLLYQPYCHGYVEPMHNAVAEILWRTAKKDVEDQINIPDQSDAVKWLQFSPIEDHFYKQQYEQCFNDITSRISRFPRETQLKSLDKLTVKQLLQPLLRLRQACCHPQAVRGAFISLQKTTLTMQELLVQMIRKTVSDCEEAHRQKVAAHNGLAGIYILQDKIELAVDEYRSVLLSIEQYKPQLRTDPLQQLHTLYNLHELLTKGGATSIPRTLRDDRLLTEFDELREKYMIKSTSLVCEAEKNLVTTRNKLQQLNEQFEEDSLWWCDVIYSNTDADHDLMDKIITELTSNINNTTFAYDFRDLRGLEFILSRKLERLQQSHDDLIVSLNTLCDDRNSEYLLNSTVECCLRPTNNSISKCGFCKTDDLFTKYETQLFSMDDKGVVTNESRRQGNWAESELERTLRTILSFIRNRGGDVSLTDAGILHMKIFEALKKEFRCLRSVWMLLKEQIAAKDELSMATTRLRLSYPGEIQTVPPQLHVLNHYELDPKRMKFIGEKLTAENALKRKLGQLQYLQNLEKSNDTLTGGLNPEPCPICQQQLGVEWSVLHCGHCFCLQCSRILIDGHTMNRAVSATGNRGFKNRNAVIRCAVCRQVTQLTDISYVSTKPARNDCDEIQVKGDYSTKITEIVRCLFDIQCEQPRCKTLVFSNWVEILDVLSKALIENDINFKMLHNQQKFQENVDEFRQNEDVSALLLPVHLGANGLNLIEATHVLLVDPILNVNQERQAIGRVHRIGQTKKTFVHRFLIRGTVEEKIHMMLQTIDSTAASSSYTAPTTTSHPSDTQLTIGDLGALFNTCNSNDTDNVTSP
ncbi:E3 ubiquitin-protein ligase SHPRH-like isoform X2 [Tubulanus polymorphus]|uniref:E3 ubiquitin-protein ligase SHPRH-like isoform X2 n=1 Tax=Tubulanus polymorphus TaxID=672921 RepID=UPI003DA57104